MNEKMQGQCEGCCGGMMCGHQHHWMHVIIRILVAIFIFWCGVQFGELKAMIRNESGYGYGSYGMMNRAYGPIMMSGEGIRTVQTTEATTTRK